jgi:UDP-2-acetamido-2,6-beta-L-arabino-hexul-4-ose reductase
MSSSIQAELDNPYGQSKKQAEDAVFAYQTKTNNEVYVYRLPNVFGKWSLPNYNTVVATFCHNIARNIDIQINNPETQLTLVYIDDIVSEWIRLLETKQAYKVNQYCKVLPEYKITLKGLADTLVSFKQNRSDYFLPVFDNMLTKKLYSTYLSFLPENEFSYPLKMNVDLRGSFTEFVKSNEKGQVSINISKPGIVKGNHWHHTKTEKFLVVSGTGVVRFRRIDSDQIIEYHVSEDKLEVVDIPCGYTHNIENIGEKVMVTVMWANETLNPDKPDTYFLEV